MSAVESKNLVAQATQILGNVRRDILDNLLRYENRLNSGEEPMAVLNTIVKDANGYIHSLDMLGNAWADPALQIKLKTVMIADGVDPNEIIADYQVLKNAAISQYNITIITDLESITSIIRGDITSHIRLF